MLTIDLKTRGLTLMKLLKRAEKDHLLLCAEDGRTFVLAPADNFLPM